MISHLDGERRLLVVNANEYLADDELLLVQREHEVCAVRLVAHTLCVCVCLCVATAWRGKDTDEFHYFRCVAALIAAPGADTSTLTTRQLLLFHQACLHVLVAPGRKFSSQN